MLHRHGLLLDGEGDQIGEDALRFVKCDINGGDLIVRNVAVIQGRFLVGRR